MIGHMKTLETPEARENKKLRKLLKQTASCVGGGVALWLLKTFYPAPEGSEKITALFGDLAVMLIIYGLSVMAVLIVRRAWAFKINTALIWLIIPTYVMYSLVRANG